MSRLPRWIKVFTGCSESDKSNNNRHRDEDYDIAHQNIVLLWRDFLDSATMQQILDASKPRHLPHKVAVWEAVLRTAIRLWNELAEERTPTVYPVLCLLFKGTYLMQHYGSLEGRKCLLQQEASKGLVLAAVSCKGTRCPPGFMSQLVANHAGQLEDCTNGKTPLWILLERSFEEESPPDCALKADRTATTTTTDPQVLKAMTKGNPKAASILFRGEYPLQQACRRGYVWEGGLKELIEAAPQAALSSTSDHFLNSKSIEINEGDGENTLSRECLPCVRHHHPVCLVALAHAQQQQLRKVEEDVFLHCHNRIHRNQYIHAREIRRSKRELQVSTTIMELLLLNPTVVAEWIKND